MAERRQGEERREMGPNGLERRMGDRRDSHRIHIDVDVREGNHGFETHSGNISIGGVFFQKPLNLPTGAVVGLRFSLPTSEEVFQVEAEVVEITSVGPPQEKGTRVRFLEMDVTKELAIAKFLDDNQTA